GMLVSLPKNNLLALAAEPEVERISPDHLVTKCASHLEAATGANSLRSYSPLLGFSGLDGSGVGIAVLDSGIMASHADFAGGLLGLSRVSAAVDVASSNNFLRSFENLLALHLPLVSGNEDAYGHGAHVAGVDARRNIGSGSSRGLDGIAPSANLIDVRVLDGLGLGQVSDVITGIDWVIQNRTSKHINVMNMSLAGPATESWITDPMCRSVRKAVSSGITVVVAAGNFGKTAAGLELPGCTPSPAIDPSVITVGSANTQQTDQRSDESINGFSSRGPTRSSTLDSAGVSHFDNLLKPDLVAPGNRIVSAESNDCYLVTTYPALHQSGTNPPFMQLSGTSVAAPVVAGAVALLLPKNPGLTPPLIKAILQYTAQQVNGANILQQGAGLLNIEGATRLAGALRTDISAKVAQGQLTVGDSLLSGAMPTASSTVAGQT